MAIVCFIRNLCLLSEDTGAPDLRAHYDEWWRQKKQGNGLSWIANLLLCSE